MERVFYNFHEKLCKVTAAKTSQQLRTFIENSVLFLSVASFCTVLLSHRTFVHRGGAVKSETLTNKGWSISSMCIKSIDGFQEGDGFGLDINFVLIGEPNVSRSFAQNINYSSSPVSSLSEKDDGVSTCVPRPIQNSHEIVSTSKMMFSFAKIKGFLFLDPEILQQLNVTSQYIVISPTDPNCFGDDQLLQRVVQSMVGSETVALNWILGLYNGGRGFIQNYRTTDIIDLKQYLREYSFSFPPLLSLKQSSNEEGEHFGIEGEQRWQHQYFIFKFGVLLSSLFLFFLTTTLVSFTLRETQDRMLNFTIQLQCHIRNRRPYGSLIATHVMENMVFVPIMIGIIFFLIHCFYDGDKLLSFIILSVVWVCEVFSALSMRTIQSSIYFPQVFFAFFTLFHIYYFSCPFGFFYAALFSTVLFMLHSMIFFWNRYELPAIISGRITRESPRMTHVGQNSFRNDMSLSPSMNNNDFTEMQLNSNSNTRQPFRTQSVHRIAGGMSYPSMSSLGRISASPSTTMLHDSGFMINSNGESFIQETTTARQSDNATHNTNNVQGIQQIQSNQLSAFGGNITESPTQIG